MSDMTPPFPGDTPALMSATAAREIARAHKWLADNYRDHRMERDAAREQRQSEWWLAYALVLDRTNGRTA